jgi:muramoyltetrapeptide carboxypeptidase
MDRRKFIFNTSIAAASIPLLSFFSKGSKSTPLLFQNVGLPKALKKGDNIGVIAPGGAIFNKSAIEKCRIKLAAIGLNMVAGKTLNTQHGYLSDTDKNRAKDIMEMFTNPNINGILAMRGGSGCARVLEFLDYDVIKQNCKPFIGMSDITALLTAFYTKAEMTSFHGPVGYSTWTEFTQKYFRDTLFDKKETEMLAPDNSEFYTISKGLAQGELIGGNLTVFSQLVGTSYLPDMRGKLLFMEDINEEPYRIDRMLMQLKLAGILSKVNGIIVGEFRKCAPEEPEKSLTLKQVLLDHLSNLNIPVFYGAKFGHIKDKWTLPIGIKAEMNANIGSLKLLEPAVF